MAEVVRWWAYLHVEGGVNVKRYFEDSIGRAAVNDAYESDFVDDVLEPFEASSRDEALRIAKQHFSKAHFSQE